MALINNLYVFVENESLNRDNEITQHPVEKGLPLTDTIRLNPKTISIDGKIVDAGNLKATEIISKIEALRTSGSLITYKGRNTVGNYQIRSFNTSFPNTNWGGADFDMELVEVRIAKSAYNPKKSTAKQNTTVKKKPVIKAGSTVVFLGGSVYVSSDAKKPSANRGRSTCKVTIPNSKSSPIRTESWAIHPYHLVSTDGKKVYGWVDKNRIEGAGNAGTASVTKGGTQQVKKK